jgi:predicted amidohydrolase
VFEVDGFRFGCALCVEVSYPELFGAYAALDVDCVLFSSYLDDPIFDVLARAHAAANGLWISVSVPARFSTAMPAGVIGPNGYWLAMCPTDGQPALTCVDLDQTDRDLDIALHKARPWRAVARHGELYRSAQVRDQRSTDKTSF